MRTITSGIFNGERAREAMAVSKIRIAKQHLSFLSFANNSSGQLDLEVPIVAVALTIGTKAYVAYRSIGGNLFLRVIDTAVSGDYTFPTTGVTDISSVAMRPGMYYDSGANTVYLFNAMSSGGGFQLQRSALSSTTDPVTNSASVYGPVFGDAFSNTASLVRRVEAICPSEGGAIVAVGTHRYTDNRSTIQFYWVTSSFAVLLDQTYQLTFTETYSGWQFASKHTTHICGDYDPITKRFSVVGNDQAHGHAVAFTVQEGITSPLRSLLYVSGESDNLCFFPCNMVRLGWGWVLAGGFRRRADVGDVKVTTVEYDTYLTSPDGVNWSFGELSSFLCLGHKKGALVFPRITANSIVVYIGAGAGYTAQPIYEIAPNAGGVSLALDDYLDNWNANFVTDGANSLDFQITLPVSPDLLADSNFVESAVATLEAGYNGETVQLGRYALDAATGDISPEAGNPLAKLKGRDLASWKLIEWEAPMTFDLTSRVMVDTIKNGWGTVKRMTPDRGLTYFSDNLIHYTGLNEPFIALSETDESGDVMIKTRVSLNGSDAYCVQSVGFAFGMSESGVGNLLMVPRQNVFSGGGHIQTKPTMLKLNLAPVDPADPEKEGTGWLFKKRQAPLWVSATTVPAISTTLSGTWRVHASFAMTANKTYDLVFILKGRRAQLYAKEYVDDPAIVSPGAVYTLMAEFLFDSTQRRSQTGKDFAGLVFCTDTYVDVDTFNGAVEKDIETGITNAREITSALASYDDWGFVDCGTTKTAIAGTTTLFDPKAKKFARQVKGRAMILTTDNTAVFMRRVRTDGVRHYLQEGQAGSGFAFPGVNPIPVGNTNYGGSDPQSWRIVLHHGYLFDGLASAKGLPDTGDMIADDEIFGYAPASFNRRGVGHGQQTWTEVPTYYWILEAGGASPNISMWWNGAQGVGDNLHGLTVAGMLVEIMSQNGKSESDTTQYYVQSFNEAATPAAGNTDSITLNQAYPNEIRNNSLGAGDAACISARGKYGTIKAAHEATAAVCYFPRDTASTKDPISITVRQYQSYSGGYQSTQDLLQKLCCLAGVRQAEFKTRKSLDAPMTFSNTSGLQLPTIQNMANFVLEGNIWLPGNGNNGSGTAGITGANRFEVKFRNRFIVSVGGYATAEDRAAGCKGVLRVGLLLDSTDISADGNGDRWLEVATVPFSDYEQGGAVSGAGTTWTYTVDGTRRVFYRLIVQGGIISIELNGQPLWTWNLDDFSLVTGVPIRSDEAAQIVARYTQNPPNYSTTLFLQELGEEAGRFIVPNGAAASSAISTIAANKKLQFRPTSSGGILFTRFEKRDSVGTISENLWKETYSRESLTHRTHRLVKGKAYGEALDVSEIIAHGYRYSASDANDIATTESAQLEAQLLMRQEAEQSLMTTIEGIGLLEAEPEDGINLTYTGMGNTPSHPFSAHVINAMQLKGARDINGTYSLRRSLT